MKSSTAGRRPESSGRLRSVAGARPARRRRVGLACLLFALSFAGARAEPAALGETVGRVLVREAGAARQKPARAGARLEPGAALITGRGARAELLDEGGARWRVGALAVWQAEAEGVRLFSGSALALVPGGGSRRVDALGGTVWLGEGVWMLTAVRNEGLKIVCLEAGGELRAPLADPAAGEAARRLRAGELVFLRPQGEGFGPVVTIFLTELLATSRLVNGFAAELPERGRLQAVATAQAERLSGVTEALVAGASDARGFEVVVPGRARPATSAP